MRTNSVLTQEQAEDLFIAFREIDAIAPEIEKTLGADHPKYLTMLESMNELRSALIEAGFTPPLSH